MPIKTLIRNKKFVAAIKKQVSVRKLLRPTAEAVIDFPREGELVMLGHYAVRISAKPGAEVEISTNGTDWNACREAVGHFWFDWWPTRTGRVSLSIRVKAENGRWKKVSDRSCAVIGGTRN